MANELAQDRVKELFDYNQETGILTRRGVQNYLKYIRRKRDIIIDGKLYKTHRIIWLWVYGSFPKYKLKRIDGNKQNNRINNLKELNLGSDTQEIKISEKNIRYRRGKYLVQMYFNNKHHYIGSFGTLIEAVTTRDQINQRFNPSKTNE